MSKKTFSIGEAIKTGWTTMKNHIGFFIGLLILGFISILIPYGIAVYYGDKPGLALVFWIIYFVLSIVVHIGYIKVSLDYVDKGKARIIDLWTGFPLFFKFLIANILYALLLFAGLILLVFPMFIWMARYGFYPYFIVDKKLGPIKAMQAAAKLSMGAKWDIIALFIVCYLIVILGVICLGVGVFAAFPTVLVANAWVYRKLFNQTDSLDKRI